MGRMAIPSTSFPLRKTSPAPSLGLSLSRSLKLPSAWKGTGHVIYNNQAYYVNQVDDVTVVKYDITTSSVTDSAVFPVQDHVPVYGLTPETVMDLAVDEEGLWAIYATRQNERHISLAKMDANSLDIEQMWDTNCPRENAESAFVICGTLYVVYNTKEAGRSRVQCVFDVNGMVSNEEAPLVYFPKRYGSHSSLKYNPQEQLLYAWDDGYQILYKLVMKKKLEIWTDSSSKSSSPKTPTNTSTTAYTPHTARTCRCYAKFSSLQNPI